MYVYLHIPAYRLGKDMPEREVRIDLPIAPFVGMQIGVHVGDGTAEAPGQSAVVQVASVRIHHTWRLGRTPEPIADSESIEVYTNWALRPGTQYG